MVPKSPPPTVASRYTELKQAVDTIQRLQVVGRKEDEGRHKEIADWTIVVQTQNEDIKRELQKVKEEQQHQKEVLEQLGGQNAALSEQNGLLLEQNALLLEQVHHQTAMLQALIDARMEEDSEVAMGDVDADVGEAGSQRRRRRRRGQGGQSGAAGSSTGA